MKKKIIFDNPNISHSCLINFQFVYPNLKSAEHKAADFCLSHPELIAALTITEVAEQANCSEATLVRLAKRLGYSGYPELRSKILKTGNEAEEPFDFMGVSPDDTPSDVLTNIFKSCILYIQDSLNNIDIKKFNQALQTLLSASKLLFVAAGDAHFTAASGAQKFMRLGYPVEVSTDFDTQLLRLSQMSEKDAVICISHSGRTKTVYDLAKIAREYGINVITITNFPMSPLAKISDVVLLTASFPYDSMDEIIVKRVPALCLLDSLYICVRMHHTLAVGENDRTNHLLSRNKI